MKTTRVVYLTFLFLLLETANLARAQPGTSQTGSNNPYSYRSFNPTVVIIIVIIVTSLFFMVCFSIYIRECSDSSTALLPTNVPRANMARGLDRSTMESFPVFTYSEVKEHKIVVGGMECAVCLNEFEDHDMLRLIPKCDHVFHPECIDAWFASHVTCPVCRANLLPIVGNEPVQPTLDLTTATAVEDCSVSSRNSEVIIQLEDENQCSNSLTRPKVFGLGKFRSYSTGHSLGEMERNCDQFTLRLPAELRKEMIIRALLNRTFNNVSMFPREASSRKGYRVGDEGEGSNRARWFDQKVKSDRWAFLARTLSIDSRADINRIPIKLSSFKCLQPGDADETVHISDERAKVNSRGRAPGEVPFGQFSISDHTEEKKSSGHK